MTYAPRVVWREGMHLSQHHFQAQSRHHEDAIHFALSQLYFRPYGLAGLALVAESLRNGVARVVHARGVMPDGLAFNVPESDAAPAPHDIREAFSPTEPSHLLVLAVPAFRRGGANLADGNGAAGARFAPVATPVLDELTGRDERQVDVGRKRLRLLLDAELAAGEVALPIARVRRDGAGHFVYDPDYVPPCLQVGASPRLLALLARLVEMLDAKGDTLRGAAASGGEVAGMWLLHAVHSAVGPLRHLLRTRHVHPERLYQELVRLAGALCTFAAESSPRDLPAYDHDAPEACFADLERHIHTHLGVVVQAATIAVPLGLRAPTLHAGAVPDARCYGPSRWVLGVRTGSPAAALALAQPAPGRMRVCAARYVLELVRRGYPGLAMEPLPTPPAAVAPRPDTAYFTLTRGGPCWETIQQTGEVGVYVPETLPIVDVELTVVPEA